MGYLQYIEHLPFTLFLTLLLLAPGDKWAYAHESRDQSLPTTEIHKWKTEETVTGSWPVPRGNLTAKHVRIIAGTPRFDYRLDETPAELTSGNCVYRLTSRDWNQRTHQLTSEYNGWLNEGQIAPDFCFPLTPNKTWGAPSRGSKDWKVVAVNAQDTIHIVSTSSYLGSGETAEVWFKEGVGMVREDHVHHGTIAEHHTNLIGFEPRR